MNGKRVKGIPRRRKALNLLKLGDTNGGNQKKGGKIRSNREGEKREDQKRLPPVELSQKRGEN